MLKVIILRNSGCRYYSQKCETRVRFAPSPTGFLHLGGLRTALYNYLFAKSRKGKIILRIEDTDQTRKVPGAVEKLVENLTWAGIEFDEGPVQGGSYGPYIQSQRLEIYRTHKDRLLESGGAYRCFCTPRRLDMLRREAIKTQQIPKYDNRCQKLSKDESLQRAAAGEEFCVRLPLTSEVQFNDLLHGPISFNLALVEGDPVIFKTDGFPTYHLANVVDDHLMGVSHVLRGVEWQISTPKHLLLYRAFGWSPPEYGHLPLILNTDGSKLSKRQKDINLEHFISTGVLPEALINFVTRAGGGFNINHEDRDQESFTMHQLIQKFDLKRLNIHSCKLDMDKLTSVNNLTLQRLLSTKEGKQSLVKQVQALVKQHFSNSEHYDKLELDDDHVVKVLDWSINRLTTLNDLLSKQLSFVWVQPQLKHCSIADKKTLELLKQLNEDLPNLNYNEEDLKIYFEKIKTQSLNYAKFMSFLRLVLSELKEGPSVIGIMEILGKSQVQKRIDNAINLMEQKVLDSKVSNC